jgi:hypothetical protein
MVPVGGLSKLRLCVLCNRGDLGLRKCLPIGLLGGWNARDGWSSSCAESTLGGRLMEGRLCEFGVSIGEGVSI